MTSPGSPGPVDPVSTLAKIACELFFAGFSADELKPVEPILVRLVGEAYSRLDAAGRRKLLSALKTAGQVRPPRAPPSVAAWLRRALGLPGLNVWARSNHPQLLKKVGADKLKELITDWLAGQKPTLQSKVLEAGVRAGVGLARDTDQDLLRTTLGDFLSSMEEKMAITFQFDTTRLPRSFSDPLSDPPFALAYKTAVINELKNILSAGQDPPQAVEGAIIGMLLLDGHFDHKAAGFVDDIRAEWLEFLHTFEDTNGNAISTRDVYDKILDLIPALRPPQGPDIKIFYQEFATVGRHVIESVVEVPPGHQLFVTQVRLGFDQYVAGKPPLESLELPPLTDADGTDVEIEPENIRAVALVYAAWCLEEMHLFHAVDRITEVFLNGALAVGFDPGGKALDEYYWDREDRLTEAERRMQYSRILGTPGGDVSKEVQPNTAFDGLWLRFLSSLAEFDRQQRVDELIDNGNGRPRPQNLTSEYVRKAGRDLAANVSLYGWGGTQFAARRLNDHIDKAIKILKQPPIQKAYGVTNAYQVIERVMPVTPNIVRYRTMADAGNKILNIVALHHKVWSRTNGQPLFEEIDAAGRPIPGDIPRADQQELARQTQFWLAVNGVKDEQVNKLSQPELSTYAPSIPSFGGMMPGGAGSNGHAGSDNAVERLRQLVSQGQVPTLDQLQALLPGAKAGV